MGRFLWALPLGLILAAAWPAYLLLRDDQGLADDDPLTSASDTQICSRGQCAWAGVERNLICEDIATCLGMMPSVGVAAGLAVPWTAFYQIGKKDLFPLENILKDQPAQFLQMCLDKYDREIQGYKVVFYKKERVNNKLQPHEKIFVHFQQKPFSVHFHWLEGGGGGGFIKAKKVLYVEGKNNGNMRVLPKVGFPFGDPLWTKDPDGEEAMATSRFSIKQFGVRHGLQSTISATLRAQAAGTLNIKYLGEFKVGELGGRACYKFVRTPYTPPEEDGINHYTFYIDMENWLHVGSELRDANGELIAEYYFRDLQPNVEFEPNQFTDKGMTP